MGLRNLVGFDLQIARDPQALRHPVRQVQLLDDNTDHFDSQNYCRSSNSLLNTKELKGLMNPEPEPLVADDLTVSRSGSLPGSQAGSKAVSPADRYTAVRNQTLRICEPLEKEDYVIQSMEDASPTKWHLAHTTWFFEVFVLARFAPDYTLMDDQFPFLFNSYYIQAGDRWSRPHRGILSRPTVDDVMAYREYVDAAMGAFLETGCSPEAISVLEIGLNHEQQHQELMVTDIKHVLSVNPLYPSYHKSTMPVAEPAPAPGYLRFDAGVVNIGHDGTGFCYDNEEPRHRQFLEAFELSKRPVTNGEFLAFMKDDGYGKAPLWMAQGWDIIQKENRGRPLYWLLRDDEWYEFTLYGLKPLDMEAPLCHVSWFEADAFARWAGQRLPTEFEWEHASREQSIRGQFADDGAFHARWSENRDALFSSMFGSTWEWTISHYSPHPGYKPVDGALGEYNGKFMANQFVLKGGSCATPSDHIRRTYRNFFPSDARWQFSGIRLARTV